MQAKLSEVLKEKGSTVYTISAETVVQDAVERMNELKIGALVITVDDRPEGIFTERDVLVRIVAAGKDARDTLVGEVMTSPVVVVESTNTVEDAMLIITERRCRHLPVMADGRMAGMVSIGDLTRWTVRHQNRRIKDLLGYLTS